jgi:hypothetical protein
MGFRRIVAIVVSVAIFFIIVLWMASEGPGEGIWVAIFAAIVSTTLFCYGLSESKSRPQDEVTKEDITRIETSVGELRKQMDEIHEYIADMYIRYDEERSKLE